MERKLSEQEGELLAAWEDVHMARHLERDDKEMNERALQWFIVMALSFPGTLLSEVVKSHEGRAYVPARLRPGFKLPDNPFAIKEGLK